MKRILSLIFLLSLLTHGTAVLAEVIDRCVAVVNNDVITQSEVNEAGKPLFQRVAEQAPSGELGPALQEARKRVLEKLIDKKLLLQEAKRYNMSVSDEEVDKALGRILAQNHTSKELFKKELAKMGMTEAQYLEDLHDQILSSKLVNVAVRSKVIIPEEKIIDYYDMHYTERVGDGGFYILQIGCSWDSSLDGNELKQARKKALKKAERVRSLALAGQDFKKLAHEYSDLPSAVDGGDIGVFKENEMAPAMRKAIIGLKPGEVSTIVETPSGYQVFKLLSSQEGQIVTKVPYESVKDEIREILYRQEMQKLYKNWLEELRSQSYVRVF